MRALLLLVILLAIQPVVSEKVADCWMNGKCRLLCEDGEEHVLRCSNRRQHVLRCMGNMGICRTSCKKTEQPYLYCRNYKTCCLQSYMKINVISKEDRHEQNKVARWPNIP